LDLTGATGGTATTDAVGKNGGAVNITAGAGSAKNGSGATDGDGGDVVLAGGAESMSSVPFTYTKKAQEVFMSLGKATPMQRMAALWKIKGQLIKPIVGLQEALTDPVCGLNMGQTAEVVAKEFGISRREQDEFSLLSHQKAAAAKAKLAQEIVPVHVGPDYKTTMDFDNGVREKQSIEDLTKLKPYFERGTGTVTPGNASQITDGAAAVLVMKEEQAKALGYKPLGYIRSYSYEGLDPRRMGLGPAFAIPSALKKAGLTLKDIELFEINEAFAAQVIGCERALASDAFCKKELGLAGAYGVLRREILNVNGGGIALGHPVGVTGTRIILTLLKELARRGQNLGVASLCIGGGQGAAIVLERE
jgi:acetyl-CoA acetyltransferase family protein